MIKFIKKNIFIAVLVFISLNSFSDSWIQKASITGERDGAIGFSIGTKGYVGMGYNSGLNQWLQDFWEWDQATNVWTQKSDFGGGIRANAAAFSIGSRGYVGTGGGPGLKKDFWEWVQATNTWTQKADFDGTSRYSAVGFSIGLKGYI